MPPDGREWLTHGQTSRRNGTHRCDRYWYAGRHYVAVSLSNGINVDTVVYQVSVP